jgi:formate dehydrogenase maturation protein FdhE
VHFQSRYMPCPECGASVDHVEAEAHACEQERRVSYQLFQLRDEVARFDAELAEYLASPRGRFEQFYAARTRPG